MKTARQEVRGQQHGTKVTTRLLQAVQQHQWMVRGHGPKLAQMEAKMRKLRLIYFEARVEPL